ncbi:MAG: bifunctional 5,10-methylenetetrahydrofolate dehydrogenase/5,10-methenyltetrahydrofolate cyclohydrolase [Planctomycetales bacterium]|nr:bifunctional 5,10-methylenetetrahydrofolate dehydrogenase/5,10-methenyltetrahydrofolate cyclohydrolase [Planctomycetales bacterium]
MRAEILDGKSTAAKARSRIAEEVAQWVAGGGAIPTLAAVLVGDDPASQVYVRNKEKACQKAGMQSRLIRQPDSTTTEQLLDLLAQLNLAPEVHGILVQLPLPKQIDTQSVLDAVDPIKDVDAFAPENVGLLVQGRPRYLPCTPHGIVHLLAEYRIETLGKHVVIVGRSDIVGKPLANMLVQRDAGLGKSFANATVTVCHSQSENLASITRSADILVAAVGRPKLVTADMVKLGSVVIDVGINRVEDQIVGDVDFDSVCEVAAAITPVPGGIGPLTIAMLLRNTLNAAKLQAIQQP